MNHISLWSQIRVALFAILLLGESKHEYKKRGDDYLYFSYYQTYRAHISRCWSLIKVFQEKYGINMLIEIRPGMVRAELERRINAGYSPWIIWVYASALKKLEIGVKTMYGYPVKLMPRDMKLPTRSLKLRRNRFAYTSEQTKAIIQAAYDTGSVRKYFVFRDKGLRDKEAQEVSKSIGYERLSVTYSYIPPQIRPGWRK